MWGRESRTRKHFIFLGALVVAVAAVAAACEPTKQPPPPPPQDVLVVGDSISHSFGCVLGNPGSGPGPCPGPGGEQISTATEIIGGCSISGGALLLYNSIAAEQYGCVDWPTVFNDFANKYNPKLVILISSGFELVDRWSSFPQQCDINNAFNCPTPDRQWGGGGAPLTAARNAYIQNLQGAIGLFRSHGSKVLVANANYVNPPEPLFPPGTPNSPDFLIRAWYERYGANAAPPEVWSPPNQGLTYRSSKTKVEQYNQAITDAVNALGDPEVSVFNLFSHFAPGNPRAYSNLVCPPPNDAIAPNGNSCPGGTTAISARDADGSHLSGSPGGQDILRYYLTPCVRALLGQSGGDVSKCS
jgi:hypothetical protein